MNTARIVVGAHAKFFPSGSAFTIPSAGTSSRTAKPGAADTGWHDFGVSDWSIQNTSKTSDLMAPSPGARVLYDKVTTSKGLKLKGKLMEFQQFAYQALLSSATISGTTTTGATYVPMESDPVRRGWLELTQYDQNNTLLNTLYLFVAITLPGDVQFGDKEVDIEIEADVLYSTLNTGTLT